MVLNSLRKKLTGGRFGRRVRNSQIELGGTAARRPDGASRLGRFALQPDPGAPYGVTLVAQPVQQSKDVDVGPADACDTRHDSNPRADLICLTLESLHLKPQVSGEQPKRAFEPRHVRLRVEPTGDRLTALIELPVISDSGLVPQPPLLFVADQRGCLA
jgi:hypothetical protein